MRRQGTPDLDLGQVVWFQENEQATASGAHCPKAGLHSAEPDRDAPIAQLQLLGQSPAHLSMARPATSARDLAPRPSRSGRSVGRTLDLANTAAVRGAARASSPTALHQLCAAGASSRASAGLPPIASKGLKPKALQAPCAGFRQHHATRSSHPWKRPRPSTSQRQ